ncbi:MAG: ElyC/SanA/YdcF family protein [Deltaproteobacteria bacterium]|nr:ElyC/SanA/YdcF family protein [Deltaproteobacteria bacterium]
MAAFFIKKTIGALVLPLPFCLLIIFLGGTLLWRGKHRTFGTTLTYIGMMILLLVSLTPVAERIEAPLKYRFPAYGAGETSRTDPMANKPVDYVVVLAGGHNSSPLIPVTGRLSSKGIFRMLEGIRIFRQTAGAKLVLSGRGSADPRPEAMVMAEFARFMGVTSDEVILETNSLDTDDQARMVKAIVGTQPFVLVTSAVHLPRAMALFQKQGMNPIPAPAGKTDKGERCLTPGFFFPNADALKTSTDAVHEYMGLIWAGLLGRI